jgi:UTP--glucose-1-phosphate uridylyltransferase
VEKPKKDLAPSRWALPGRYVFSHHIFDALRDTKPGRNGEIQLTDSMSHVAKTQGMLATPFKAQRFDAGDKLGYLQANIEIALKRPDIGPALKDYLKTLVAKL